MPAACPTSDAIPYIIAQLIGGIAAARVFYIILSGAPAGKWNDFVARSRTSTAGPDTSRLFQVGAARNRLTALIFSIVIVGVTSKKAARRWLGPIAIGLTLVFIHLAAIPVSNASVNPARSTATRRSSAAARRCRQLWLFWVAPIVGGVIGG